MEAARTEAGVNIDPGPPHTSPPNLFHESSTLNMSFLTSARMSRSNGIDVSVYDL
jgi:hypothetical protein